MARKGENIYKRKDGRWEGRYIKSRSSTGKANYGYVYAKSYREVKAKLISQSSCTSNSVTVDPEISSDQFEQVAMEWFQAICPKVKELKRQRRTQELSPERKVFCGTGLCRWAIYRENKCRLSADGTVCFYD